MCLASELQRHPLESSLDWKILKNLGKIIKAFSTAFLKSLPRPKYFKKISKHHIQQIPYVNPKHWVSYDATVLSNTLGSTLVSISIILTQNIYILSLPFIEDCVEII
jgi:hypothetical protein